MLTAEEVQDALGNGWTGVQVRVFKDSLRRWPDRIMASAIGPDGHEVAQEMTRQLADQVAPILLAEMVADILKFHYRKAVLGA